MAAPVTSLTVSLEVNGEQIEYDVPTRRLLVHFIRDDLGLTGTHIGCDTGNCGACTVHVNGEAVKSCIMLAVHLERDGPTRYRFGGHYFLLPAAWSTARTAEISAR